MKHERDGAYDIFKDAYFNLLSNGPNLFSIAQRLATLPDKRLTEDQMRNLVGDYFEIAFSFLMLEIAQKGITPQWDYWPTPEDTQYFQFRRMGVAETVHVLQQRNLADGRNLLQFVTDYDFLIKRPDGYVVFELKGIQQNPPSRIGGFKQPAVLAEIAKTRQTFPLLPISKSIDYVIVIPPKWYDIYSGREHAWEYGYQYYLPLSNEDIEAAFDNTALALTYALQIKNGEY